MIFFLSAIRKNTKIAHTLMWGCEVIVDVYTALIIIIILMKKRIQHIHNINVPRLLQSTRDCHYLCIIIEKGHMDTRPIAGF